MEGFNQDISQIKREDLFSDLDPNIIWKKLRAHCSKVIEKHCPMRGLKVTQDRPAYLNEEILQLMKDRDIAYKVARKEKTEETWIQARALRSEVQRELFKAKRD